MLIGQTAQTRRSERRGNLLLGFVKISGAAKPYQDQLTATCSRIKERSAALQNRRHCPLQFQRDQESLRTVRPARLASQAEAPSTDAQRDASRDC